MRFAYLIMAHDCAAQLDMLIERLLLQGEDDIAIVHADARSTLFQNLQERELRPRTILVPDPVAVRWGHSSQVTAILKLIETALEHECDFAHYISGVDWPAASRDEVVAEIQSHEALPCCIEAVPGEIEERMQSFRLDTRWLRLDPKTDRVAYELTWQSRRVSRWIDDARRALGRERSRPFGPWHKGSSWWSLPREALRCIAEELPPLIASGRLAGTLCADEHVIQSLIARRFADRIACNRRFVDFERNASSPRWLDHEDLPAISASGSWFARKLSLDHDPFFLALPALSQTANRVADQSRA